MGFPHDQEMRFIAIFYVTLHPRWNELKTVHRRCGALPGGGGGGSRADGNHCHKRIPALFANMQLNSFIINSGNPDQQIAQDLVVAK